MLADCHCSHLRIYMNWKTLQYVLSCFNYCKYNWPALKILLISLLYLMFLLGKRKTLRSVVENLYTYISNEYNT